MAENKKNNKIDFTNTASVNIPFSGLLSVINKEELPEKSSSPNSKNETTNNSKTQKKYNFVAVFRLEKNGRGGKTVTVLDQLPKEEIFLQNLTKELKNKCGTGGTYITSRKEGVIEIQGDKRDQIKKILDEKGIKYKGM